MAREMLLVTQRSSGDIAEALSHSNFGEAFRWWSGGEQRAPVRVVQNEWAQAPDGRTNQIRNGFRLRARIALKLATGNASI